MKRIIPILLSLMMLTACGKSAAQENEAKAVAASTAEATTETTEATEEASAESTEPEIVWLANEEYESEHGKLAIAIGGEGEEILMQLTFHSPEEVTAEESVKMCSCFMESATALFMALKSEGMRYSVSGFCASPETNESIFATIGIRDGKNTVASGNNFDGSMSMFSLPEWVKNEADDATNEAVFNWIKTCIADAAEKVE